MNKLRLGIDIGGTFTDVILADEKKILKSFKTPSVPSAPEKACFNALMRLEKEGIDLNSIELFIHGTTLGVNTLIERNGSKTALLVTKGFRDVLELRRLKLENTTDLYGDKVYPLIERQFVREINERALANGTILHELDENQLYETVKDLQENGVKAVAISFLHSYKNAFNELKAKDFLKQNFPDMFICISSEIWPQQREYERTLVTVINAYVGQRMENYYHNLISGAQNEGLQANVLSTMSNGGIMTATKAAEEPVKTLLSGPASGVIGALQVCSTMDIDKVITFDMGGTSIDVSIIDGSTSYSTENKVGDFPIIVPAIDVTAIGAGGGSIAWLDDFGVLKVGPKSAGAHPGPVCFNLGGKEPTITDAYVELGIIKPESFANNELKLYPELSKKSLNKLGERLGLNSYQVAEAILKVATSNMYARFIPLLARRGIDPRDFSLLAYGGAGPTHAFILSKEVGISKVIVPPSPGTLCAMGSAYADLKQNFIKTLNKSIKELEENELNQIFNNLQTEGMEWIQSEMKLGITPEKINFIFSADIRYVGQSFELEVTIPKDMMNDIGKIKKLFNEKYEAIFGVHIPEEEIAFINIRATIVGKLPKSKELNFFIKEEASGKVSSTKIYLDDEWVNTQLLDRRQLRQKDEYLGPAIITSYDTTIFIPKGFKFFQDDNGNLIGELQDDN